jgi:hypothetical protein
LCCVNNENKSVSDRVNFEYAVNPCQQPISKMTNDPHHNNARIIRRFTIEGLSEIEDERLSFVSTIKAALL